MNSATAEVEIIRPARWPLLCLLAALVWVAIVRIPLVLNADSHLDSDLAVDGLTLLDTTHGQPHWHFPGTPYMSSLPIALSLPGAMLFGVNARTLVVGGVIAYELFVIATFFLVRRIFGPIAAVGSLVPLAFASVGTVWLSGRLSGGHLLTLAWHSATLALVPTFAKALGTSHDAIRTDPVPRAYFKGLIFGVWCGLGFSLDTMFVMTLPFVGLMVLSSVLDVRGLLRRLALLITFAIGFGIGDLPREAGSWFDPHDSYDQFTTVFERDQNGNRDDKRVKALLLEHARLYALECLPRLITGHRLVSSNLPTAPRPESLPGGVPSRQVPASYALSVLTVAMASLAFIASLFVMLYATLRSRTAEQFHLLFAVMGSSLLVSVFFLISKNIYDSDNYRYLVFCLVPFAAGYGRLMAGCWKRGVGGKTSALLISAAIAVVFTLDTASWYRGFGWVDHDVRPVRRKLHDPTLQWLRDHPEIHAIFGGYWDVYRYQFLAGGKLEGLPYPNYPDRLQAAGHFPNRQPRILVARKGELNNFYIKKALKDGGHLLQDLPDHQIIDWPREK